MLRIIHTICKWLSLPGKQEVYQAIPKSEKWLSFAGMAEKPLISGGSVCPE
jgi:hypothetical protein